MTALASASEAWVAACSGSRRTKALVSRSFSTATDEPLASRLAALSLLSSLSVSSIMRSSTCTHPTTS